MARIMPPAGIIGLQKGYDPRGYGVITPGVSRGWSYRGYLGLPGVTNPRGWGYRGYYHFGASEGKTGEQKLTNFVIIYTRSKPWLLFKLADDDFTVELRCKSP